MLKRTALAGLGLVLLVSPLLVSADTLSDLQAQIQQLLAQIQVLQQKANQTSTTTSSGSSCVSLSNSLSLDDTDADTNGDVSTLQKFLAQDSSIYPGGRVTGYFGPATQKAVQRWQSANDLVSSGDPDTTGYGYVGPKTRAAMAQGCGSTVKTTQPTDMPYEPQVCPMTTIITSCAVGYHTSGMCGNECVPDDNTGGASFFASPTYGSAPLAVTFTIATNNTVDFGDGTQSGHCLDSCPTTLTFPHTYTSAGTYYAWLLNASGQKIGNHATVITVTDSNSNASAPVVNGIDGPTSLNAGQIGKWTVRATVPNQPGAQLSYSVQWGDEGGFMSTASSQASASIQTSATFTHIYKYNGTYTPTFTVKNSGGSAQTSATVTVGGTSSASITVTTPNGGGYWYRGNSALVEWKTVGVPTDNQMLIRLRSVDTNQEYNLTTVSNDGSEKIIVPTTVPVGAYTLEIKTAVNNQSYLDASDSYFKVVDGTTSAPTVTVTSVVAISQGQLVNVQFANLPAGWNMRIIGVSGSAQSLPVTTISLLPVQGSYTGNSVADYTLPYGGPNFTAITVPATAPVGSYVVEVSDPSGGWATKLRTMPFYVGSSVSSSSITVTAPNGGEQFSLGTTYFIRAKKSGIKSVSIALYKNDQFVHWITSDLNLNDPSNDTLEYGWTPQLDSVGGVAPSFGNVYKIYIIGTRTDGQGYVEDKSDAPFGFVSGQINESVGLSSVVIGTEGIAVTYNKNFETCAHLVNENSQILHTQNYFCGQGTNRAVVPSPSDLSANVYAGQVVKLCHGNNGSICSGLVRVTGSAVTTPSITASPSSGSLTLSGSPTLWVETNVSGYTPQGNEVVDFGDGSRYALGYTTTTNNRHDYHTPGVYTVNLMNGTQVIATTQVTVTALVTTSAPTLTLTANPTTISHGQTTTLSWSAANASSCSTNSGPVAFMSSVSQGTYGVFNTPPLAAEGSPFVFMITCTGAGGSVSKSVTVTVTPAQTPAPTATITSSLSIPANTSFQIIGTASPAGSYVHVVARDTIWNGLVSSDGTWSVYSGTGFPAGSYPITVNVFSPVGGIVGTLLTSGTLVIAVPTPAPTTPIITADGTAISNGGIVTIPPHGSVTLRFKDGCAFRPALFSSSGGYDSLSKMHSWSINEQSVGSYTIDCSGMDPLNFTIVIAPPMAFGNSANQMASTLTALESALKAMLQQLKK